MEARGATTSTSDSRVDARDSEIDEEEEMDIALTVAAEQPQCRSKGRDAELLPRTGVFLMFMIYNVCIYIIIYIILIYIYIYNNIYIYIYIYIYIIIRRRRRNIVEPRNCSGRVGCTPLHSVH